MKFEIKDPGSAITHFIGMLMAAFAATPLLIRAASNPDRIHVISLAVFIASMILLYAASTTYHTLNISERANRILRKIDHCMIFVLIAGSYTPFCLISLAPYGGGWLCAFVWALALAGVACEAFWVFRPRWISAVLYLLLGWCVVGFLPSLLAAVPATGLWLLVAGGVCYSIGCIFYVLKKLPYMHSIFHLWVLAGSILQFLAIALYVM